MLRLGKLPAERFQSLLEQALRTFVLEKSHSERISQDQARQIGAQQISEMLPNGQSTPGHHFLEIQLVEKHQSIGQIWLGTKYRGNWKIAFIYDFMIDRPFQGAGYGREVLRVVEDYARGLGAKKVALHVFRTNSRAISLYESQGYSRISNGANGFEMEKILNSP